MFLFYLSISYLYIYILLQVLCEAEAFMEDVILLGLEMLSMDIDLDAYKASADG